MLHTRYFRVLPKLKPFVMCYQKKLHKPRAYDRTATKSNFFLCIDRITYTSFIYLIQKLQIHV